MEDPAHWPVLMHCESGVHRTGLMTALHRMQYDGWSAEEAIDEMYRSGFFWGTRDRSALPEFLRKFEPDPERRLRE